MKLHILFGQRRCSYEGEYAPEALLCWDEYAVDNNPEGYEEDLAKTREKYASEMTSMRVIVVQVDGDKVSKLLNEDPVVRGDVLGVEG